MYLHLTSLSHLNSTYVDDSSGQVIYKVSTSNKLFNRKVTTIKRILSGNLHASSEPEASTSNRRSSDEATLSNDDDPVKSDVEDVDKSDESVDEEGVTIQEPEEGDVPDVECHQFGDFGHLAEITFKAIAPSILQFGGQEHESTQFFKKKAFRKYIRDRAFTGPDGFEYQWTMKRMVSNLVRIDSEHGGTTPIARFYRPRVGVFVKTRPASLEIFSEGMHMVDLIFITFVYVQKLRNDKEKTPHENC